MPGQALVVFAHRLGSSSLLTRGAALQPTACVSKTGRRGPFLSVVCGGNGEGCPTAAPERLFCSAMAQESPFTLLPEELQPIQDDGEECSPAGPQLVRGPDPVNSTAKQRSRVQGQGSTHWSITFAWLLGHQLGDPGDRGPVKPPILSRVRPRVLSPPARPMLEWEPRGSRGYCPLDGAKKPVN